jgi:glycosyltransferase involved in cell wall biosynthesis
MSTFRRLPFVTAERWLARATDLLLCQNREELVDIERLGLMPRQGVHHVGNGIDLRQFTPRAALPTNPRPVLLCVGRLEPVKNLPMLFRVLKRLGTRHRPVLRLVGEGPCLAEYQQEVQRLGLADQVEFLGYRYDVPELTAAADVVVLSSVKEGIPRSLMQAMAVGVPVVATDVKGTREVVVDGETGFLVPLDDAGRFAERVAMLLDSPALCREMGARGIVRASQHFDEDRVVERLAGLYRTALAERGLAPQPAASLLAAREGCP